MDELRAGRSPRTGAAQTPGPWELPQWCHTITEPINRVVTNWQLAFRRFETPSRRKQNNQKHSYDVMLQPAKAQPRAITARPACSGLSHPTDRPPRRQTATLQVSSQAGQELGYKLNNSEKLTQSPVGCALAKQIINPLNITAGRFPGPMPL